MRNRDTKVFIAATNAGTNVDASVYSHKASLSDQFDGRVRVYEKILYVERLIKTEIFLVDLWRLGKARNKLVNVSSDPARKTWNEADRIRARFSAVG